MAAPAGPTPAPPPPPTTPPLPLPSLTILAVAAGHGRLRLRSLLSSAEGERPRVARSRLGRGRPAGARPRGAGPRLPGPWAPLGRGPGPGCGALAPGGPRLEKRALQQWRPAVKTPFPGPFGVRRGVLVTEGYG